MGAAARRFGLHNQDDEDHKHALFVGLALVDDGALGWADGTAALSEGELCLPLLRLAPHHFWCRNLLCQNASDLAAKPTTTHFSPYSKRPTAPATQLYNHPTNMSPLNHPTRLDTPQARL